MKDLSCYCPSDLWGCDPVLGCVCPHGVDCGIESEEGREVVIANINQEELSGSTGGSTGVIVLVSVLVILSVIGFVIVVYYRWEYGY